MTVVMYDLAGEGESRFSPHCWATQLALAHKGLGTELVPTKFTEVTAIGDGTFTTVPVINDNGTWVGDSWRIASYLEEQYPGGPSLFGSASNHPLIMFARNWSLCTQIPGIADLILLDVFEHSHADDRDYFRSSREKMFGRTLEEVQAGREARVKAFRRALHPLRMTLRDQPYVSGESPAYADYQLFGPFMWARNASPFEVLELDDPITAWCERCLDLFDGLARASKAGSVG